MQLSEEVPVRSPGFSLTLGNVVGSCDPSTWEEQAGGSEVRGHSWLSQISLG